MTVKVRFRSSFLSHKHKYGNRDLPVSKMKKVYYKKLTIIDALPNARFFKFSNREFEQGFYIKSHIFIRNVGKHFDSAASNTDKTSAPLE